MEEKNDIFLKINNIIYRENMSKNTDANEVIDEEVPHVETRLETDVSC
jgi:hypothetical protein